MEKESNENSNLRDIEKELENLELERKRIQKLIEIQKSKFGNIKKFGIESRSWFLSISTSLILVYFILKFFIPLFLDNVLDNVFEEGVKIENGIVFRTFLVSIVNITTLPFLFRKLGISGKKKLSDFFFYTFLMFGVLSTIPYDEIQNPFSEEDLPNTLYYLVFLFHSLVSWVVVSNIKVETDE